jgi:hypothetical protein
MSRCFSRIGTSFYRFLFIYKGYTVYIQQGELLFFTYRYQILLFSVYL